MRTNGFLKAFWALTKPYWVSEKRGKALGLLVLVVGLVLALVYMEVLFNYWNRDFYNTF
jgi:putative ATP-binding cassette transporter